jgi:hypothetical protein
MPKRSSFIDGTDEFYFDEGDNLNIRNGQTDESGPRTLLLDGSVEEFIGWLTDEADRIKAEKADAAKR